MDVSMSSCLSWRWGCWCIFLLIPVHTLLKVALEERAALCTSRVLYAPVEKAHRQRGADSVYGKPMDYVEMVNTRVMGWGADIILQMMEVAKPVPLPPRHSWSEYLTPSVMAVLSLQSTWCFLFSALWSVISSDQVLSHLQLFVTPWTLARQASLSITTSQSLLKPMSIESVMSSNHLILCRPLLLLPPIPPSIRVFSN